jgi:signal transduction histidine kinase/CheY-like chemotaxis protein
VRTRIILLIAGALLPAFAVMGFAQYELHRELSRLPAAQTGLIEALGLSGIALTLGGALISLGFGVIVGEHILRRPADALVNAAQAWQHGDLATRIRVDPADTGDFARIARTFNRMAEALGEQRDALRALNAELEDRVASRTHEVKQSHERLLAEMAEREKAETALRQAQKLQAVGQLAGGIAHDFNNLLTTVMGALDLLRGRLGAGQETMIRLVDTALQAAERGSKLTGELLAFSRRQRLAPVPTDMNATIVALTELLSGTLGPAIRIETDLAEGLWPAMVDPSQMEASILNLALNARDAMPGGGTLTIATCNVTVDGRATVSPGDYVAVQVSDTGVGMSEDVLAMAFEPFFTTKDPGRASGLGLSQVHGLAMQSGGDVRIRSVPGEGTTVALLLPRAAGAPVAARAAAQAEAPARARLKARVLVVDDDANVREMAGDMLTERGFAVTLADSAETALAILAGDDGFDLLLTDFVMPGMNGLRLIQMASEEYPALRSMLMTGHAEFEAGAPISDDRILRKPFNIATLDDRVCRALGRPRFQVIQGGASASA